MPFALELAVLYLSRADPVESTAIQAATCLATCYSLLDPAHYAQAQMKEAGMKFAGLYVALERHFGDGINWRVKPKLHLFLHLLDNIDSPVETWTYRDEDYGGSAAHTVRAKGGHDTPRSAGCRLLDRVMAREAFPQVV